MPVTAETMALVPLSQPPAIAARAGMLVDGSTGAALWQKAAEQRLPIASTTKIMTALLALEVGQPEQTVRVRVGAADLPGHSVAGLRAGEQLPLADALYALMLPSGNDAALAIAATIDGSTDAFVGRMNRRAERLGLRDTRFLNPHGWDDPGHLSTAKDLASLARAALDRSDFERIVTAKTHTFRGQWVHSWTNLNQLLFRRSDAIGVKTGTSDAAGPSLVAAAARGERKAIVVLLGSPARYDEADALLDHYFDGFTTVTRQGRAVVVPRWQAAWQS